MAGMTQMTQSRRRTHFFGLRFRGSYLRAGWGDTISSRNVDREGAAMNQLETGEASEAARGNTDLQKELVAFLGQLPRFTPGGRHMRVK